MSLKYYGYQFVVELHGEIIKLTAINHMYIERPTNEDNKKALKTTLKLILFVFVFFPYY